MSYYKPSFSQAVAMTRGRGFPSSYRGSSARSSWGGPDRSRPSYGSSGRGGPGGGRFSGSFSNSFDFRPSDRYSGARHEDYKSYRLDSSTNSYSSREHRSPERKRMRTDTSSSHRSHDGFGGGDSYGSVRRPGGYPERRSFSRERDRHLPSFSHRDSFRKPPLSSGSPRGPYRGDRIGSRGLRGARSRGGPRRRLLESSYGRRRLAARSSDYARKLKLNRIRRLRAAAAARRRAREREESPKDDKEKKEKNEEDKSDGEKEKNDSSKSPKKDDAKSEKDKKSDSEGEEKSRRKDFIKLVCPHCNVRCITFGKYSMHLASSKHMVAMRRVANKQKSILARMRLAQRNAQRELEKNTDDLAPRTNFCPLCKLNYKQPKTTHQASDSHKSMKKFLMPYCKTCRITFKSPIAFESHLCSIDHIKRKARAELNGEKSEGSDNEDDLENFMTIDSVGDVDEEESPDGKKKDIESKQKEKINVGIEHIQKVEVHYCELCRMYLPRIPEGELDGMLSKHCKQRTHMQKYIRYKEDKEIQSRAEKLQRKETAEKENREKKDKEKEEEETENSTEAKKPKEDKEEETKKDKENSTADDEEAGDDKLWADVDKDLGDILREAESGNKSSDEEEDANGRYDRFKYSEKNGEDKKEAAEEVPKENEEENKPGSDAEERK